MLCCAFSEKSQQGSAYGNGIKAHAVYLSQYQLLPYKRIQEYFADQLQMPISEGSLYNFNQQAYEQLAAFEAISKERLVASPILHADETGININLKKSVQYRVII